MDNLQQVRWIFDASRPDLPLSCTQVTLVTAKGDILTVNENENSDLFWGVRGGGGNFGVVTEFVYRLHEQRRTVFCGPLIFPGPILEVLAKTTLSWMETRDPDKEGMMQAMSRGPDGHVSYYSEG